MKNLTFVTALLVGLGATTAQAKTVCNVQSDSISTIEVQQDGGEENLTITSTSGQKARLLVLRNHGGVTIAVVDTAITKTNVNSGLIMVKNPAGTTTVAVEGQILTATCEEK